VEAAPSNADAGQRELFRAYLGSRPAFYALLIGCAAAFAYGAYEQSPLVMAAGPAAVILGVAAIAFFVADRTAAERFYRSFASSLGLTHVGRRELLTLTPLLGAGDRRWCEHWMEGPEYSLGHYVWEELERTRDKDGDLSEVKERHTVSLCVVELEESLSRFKGVYLRPRRASDDWLPKSLTREIEVESSAFTERYELRIAEDMDELRVRQLLAPTLVSWLASHPLTPGFELKAGTLAVFVTRPLEDAGNLTFLLDATRHLAERIRREVAEGVTLPAS
jgi:hypothetical protein